MSLELTDEERAKVIELTNSAASFVIHTPRRFLPIILKLQAGKMRAEWDGCMEWTHKTCKCVWTDEQWMNEAQGELSREGKG